MFLNIVDFLVYNIIERVSSLAIFTPCLQRGSSFVNISGKVHLYSLLSITNHVVHMVSYFVLPNYNRNSRNTCLDCQLLDAT